jgi:hypothetical protein
VNKIYGVKQWNSKYKVYFMGSEMQPGVMRAQKRNLLVMKFFYKSCDLSIDQKF